MTNADASYVALIAIGLSVDSFVLWPKFLRRSEAEPAGARVWLWSSFIVLLWALVAAGVAGWVPEERSRAKPRPVGPHGWRKTSTVGPLLAARISLGRAVSAPARARRSDTPGPSA